MAYLVKTGSNQALVDLVAMTPQPRSTGVQAVERTYGADGSVYESALYVELKWDVLESAADYATLLAQFGLTSVLFANVTLYAPNAAFSWVRYNGIAVRPQIGQDGQRRDYFLRDFTIIVKALAVLA